MSYRLSLPPDISTALAVLMIACTPLCKNAVYAQQQPSEGKSNVVLALDSFDGALKGWSGWAPHDLELPTIEATEGDGDKRSTVARLQFPYGPGTKTIQKALKGIPAEATAVAFWAKAEGRMGRISVGVRLRDLAIYAAPMPFVGDEWQRVTIPLTAFAPKDASSNPSVDSTNVVLLSFSAWLPEDTTPGDGEALELLLDDIDFITE